MVSTVIRDVSFVEPQDHNFGLNLGLETKSLRSVSVLVSEYGLGLDRGFKDIYHRRSASPRW